MKMHLSMKHAHLTPPDLTRRRLLTALALSPLLYSLPGWTANSPKIDSRRVVALEWLPVELLLALGVTPYGVADTHNYRLWVEEPELPASVIDIGQRTEPNLELLQQMAPSLILMSEGFGPSPEKLAPIAPSMSFAFSQQGSTPLAVGKNSLRALGQRLGLEAAAEQHLNDFNQFMQAARQRFSASRNTSLLMFSLLDTRTATQAIDRLVDVFPVAEKTVIQAQLAASLRAVIAQKLCHKVGGGRIAVFEILTQTTAASHLIREGKTYQLPSVIQSGGKWGMQTFEQGIAQRQKQGVLAERHVSQ